MIDRAKLALIHILKKKLQLGEQEYRNLLADTVGVRSAKDLDEQKFRKLMERFAHTDEQGMSLRQKLFIDSLVERLHWEPEHLGNFLQKYYHKAELSALTRRESGKLIESLKHIHEHVSQKDVYEIDHSGGH